MSVFNFPMIFLFLLGTFLFPIEIISQDHNYFLFKVKARTVEQVEQLHQWHNFSKSFQDTISLQPVERLKSAYLLIESSQVPEFETTLKSKGIPYTAKGKTLINRVRSDDLVPILPMIGAGGIFTGIPYRIFFRDFPNAPLTYRETNFRADQLIAERRSAEWPKYETGGSRELDGSFMFIRRGTSNFLNNFVNLGLASKNNPSCLMSGNNVNPDCSALYCSYFYNNFCTGVSYTPREIYPDLFQIRENTYILAWESGTQFSAVSDNSIYTSPVAETRTLFNIRIAGAGLTGNIISFELLEDPATIDRHLREVTMVQAHDIINNSSSPITQTVTAERAQADTFTFGFQQSLKIFSTVTAEAGLPLIGKATTESGIEANFGFNQELSSTSTHTFTISQEVTVAPFKRVRIHGVLSIADNVVMPFRARMEVTLNINRLTTYGWQIVQRPVPADLLEEYLKANRVEGTIIERRGNTVVIEVTGTVRGTWGINSLLHVNEAPV